MLLIFTQSIIQNKFYVDICIEISQMISIFFPSLDLIISAPHWYMIYTIKQCLFNVSSKIMSFVSNKEPFLVSDTD